MSATARMAKAYDARYPCLRSIPTLKPQPDPAHEWAVRVIDSVRGTKRRPWQC